LNLAKEQIDNLPYSPGVYYFHNEKGKIIYVGKAKNIKYRVSSHFTHNGPGRQRQDFLRNIHTISYQSCSTELMAFILESIEIKRLWPRYNSSLKRFTPAFGLYLYEDRNGYLRFAIDKKNRSLQPLYTFNLLVEGHRLVNKLINEFELCPKLCFIQTGDERCIGITNNRCRGACEQIESPEDYNSRFTKALEYLENMLPTFAVVDEGKNAAEQSCILIEKGRFYGMGYFPASSAISSPGDLKNYLQPYPENDYIRGLVYSYVEKRPEKKMIW
jgi:DNA polymerase-3 subunit epsilon